MKLTVFKMRYNFYVLFLAFISFSCEIDKKEVDLSFYHWKTYYSIEGIQQSLLDKANSEKLYLRYFDLKFNEEQKGVFPVATLQKEGDNRIKIATVIPVVYITNNVFEKTIRKDIPELAFNTVSKINRLNQQLLLEDTVVREIQFDCDWTLTTKENYFFFLEEIKRLLASFQSDNQMANASRFPLELSSTIRLHQVKFKEKTGVPPVDKGVIMAYNVGDLSDISEKNSIINNEKTALYLKKLDEYPLDFSIAFPTFSWGVLYRDNTFSGLLNTISTTTLADVFEEMDKPNFYRATKDQYIDGKIVYKGDILRHEKVTKKNLKKLYALFLKSTSREYPIILYHINSSILTHESTLVDIFK